MTPSKPLCVDILEDVFTLSALADAHLNLALVWREHLSGIIIGGLELNPFALTCCWGDTFLAVF
jgi:hypothetical protein